VQTATFVCLSLGSLAQLPLVRSEELALMMQAPSVVPQNAVAHWRWPEGQPPWYDQMASHRCHHDNRTGSRGPHSNPEYCHKLLSMWRNTHFPPVLRWEWHGGLASNPSALPAGAPGSASYGSVN